jgi:septal ring factor EnvC (AmiA/AmiB activator)
MAEVTNELIYDVLKAVQARFGNLEEAIRDERGQLAAIRVDLRAVHAEIGSVKADIANIYRTQGAMDSRLARIQRRLDIIDTPVN